MSFLRPSEELKSFNVWRSGDHREVAYLYDPRQPPSVPPLCITPELVAARHGAMPAGGNISLHRYLNAHLLYWGGSWWLAHLVYFILKNALHHELGKDLTVDFRRAGFS